MPSASGENGQQQKSSGLYRNLYNTRGAKLFELLQHDELGKTLGETPEEAFEVFAAFDPTADRAHKPYGYLNWLLKTYIESYNKQGETPIAIADMPDIKYDLGVFHEYKKRLPSGKSRDIFQYNAPKLCELVLEVTGEDALSVRALKRRQGQKMRDQSVVLYEGPEGMIVTPKTIEASKYWGQGATWCTQGDSAENHFRNYAPLVIYMPSKVSPIEYTTGYSKFQGCGNEDNYKIFYHAQNRAAEYIPAGLKSLIDAALDNDPGLSVYLQKNGSLPFVHIEPQHRTREGWIHELTEGSSLSFAHVPDELWQDVDFAKTVIKNVQHLLCVPEQYRTIDLYLHVLPLMDNDHRAPLLDSAPRDFWQDEAFRHGATDSYPAAYKHCPKQLRDSYMCVEAVKDQLPGSVDMVLKEMPTKLWKDSEFRARMVGLSWEGAFRNCPPGLRDENMCMTALENCADDDEEVLPNIPREIWESKDFCAKALEQTWESILYFPADFLSKQNCLKALEDCEEDRDNVMNIIPPSFIEDRTFRYAAADVHWGFIKYCPEDLQDDYICLKALAISQSFEKDDVIQAVAERFWKDQTFCSAAYAHTKEAWKYIPADIQQNLFPDRIERLGEEFKDAAAEDGSVSVPEPTEANDNDDEAPESSPPNRVPGSWIY